MEVIQSTNSNGHNVQNKPPTVLDGFTQPGFPFAKIFTCFFFNNCVVFAKTGSFGINSSGTIRGVLGGFTPTALIAGAIGLIFDMRNDQRRSNRAMEMADFNPENMVYNHKLNFMLLYDEVENVEIKGPNFARELRIVVNASKIHKFRIDRQSKESAKYIERVFNEFLPGKVVKKE